MFSIFLGVEISFIERTNVSRCVFASDCLKTKKCTKRNFVLPLSMPVDFESSKVGTVFGPVG